MIDTNQRVQLNSFSGAGRTRRMVIPSRMIWSVLLLLFLMTPTNGRGLPPYLLITVLSVPFVLRRFKLSLNKEYGFLIYYALVYVSSLFIHYYSGSIILSISFIAYFVLSPVIVMRTIKTKRDFNSIISVIVVLFSVYSILGIFEAISGVNVFDLIFGRSGSALWAGVGITRYGMNLSYGFLRIMHNNATLMCMIWAIAAYQLCNAKRHRLFWTCCWLLIGAYDIVMMSRMVIFTAPILQLIIFRKRGSQWLSKRLFVIIVVALVIIGITGSDVLSSIFNVIGGLIAPIIDEFFGTSLKAYFDSSLGGSGQRLILWNWIIDAVKGNALFGKGLTDVWSTTISGKNYLGQTWYTEKTSIEVHWLYTLYRMGIFGLSGFIVFQIGVLLKTWKAKVQVFEETVSFQFVMKWIAVFYFIHLFGIAAAEELNFFYFLFAIYMCYVTICNNSESSPKAG